MAKEHESVESTVRRAERIKEMLTKKHTIIDIRNEKNVRVNAEGSITVVLDNHIQYVAPALWSSKYFYLNEIIIGDDGQLYLTDRTCGGVINMYGKTPRQAVDEYNQQRMESLIRHELIIAFSVYER